VSKTLVAMFAVLAVLAVLVGGCGDADLGGAPDVRGLSLPDAERQLKGAGMSASVTSDGLFGVVIRENWTVCEQDSPNGKLVPLEVSKQC
jgi:hypothetical protein